MRQSTEPSVRAASGAATSRDAAPALSGTAGAALERLDRDGHNSSSCRDAPGVRRGAAGRLDRGVWLGEPRFPESVVPE